jgi:hypothetical protein
LWSADGEVADLAVPARVAPGARVREMVGDDAVVLVADGVLLATMGPEADGIWSGSRIMVGVVQAALRDLTATSEELNQPDG